MAECLLRSPPLPSAHRAMPIDLSFDQTLGIAVLRVVGTADVEEVFSCTAAMVEHKDFVRGMPSLWDLTEADVEPVNRGRAERVGHDNKRLADRRGQARVAIVGNDDLRFGIARMLGVLSTSPNLEVMVFRDLKSAQEWAVSEDGSDER